MSKEENRDAATAGSRTTGKTESTGDAGAPGRRYFLTLTDPDNPMVGGNLTITIEVKDNAVESVTASDDADNTYEVTFSIKKPGGRKRAGPASAAGRVGASAAGAASVASVESDGPQPPAGGLGPGPGGEDEDDDECQCCSVVGGRLVCRTCPCP